jgi:hypothetical protein
MMYENAVLFCGGIIGGIIGWATIFLSKLLLFPSTDKQEKGIPWYTGIIVAMQTAGILWGSLVVLIWRSRLFSGTLVDAVGLGITYVLYAGLQGIVVLGMFKGLTKIGLPLCIRRIEGCAIGIGVGFGTLFGVFLEWIEALQYAG